MAYEIKLDDPSNDELVPASTPATQMGPNPYFPDEELPPEQGASADPGQPAPEDGQENPEPTFDPVEDAAAGIDVNSPNYKHFQAAFTRKMQAAKGRDLAAELDAMKMERTQQKIVEGDTTAPAPEIQSFELKWDGFRPGMLPADNPLSGTEADISTLVRQHVEYAVAQVNRQNEQFYQTQKLAQTRDYLTQVVDEIGNYAGPEKKQEALTLLQEHIGVAKADPVKWARFAVNYLGIQVEQPPAAAAPAPAHSGNAARTVQQIKGQATRPSQSSGASAPKPKTFSGPNATAAAIGYALDQQMRR
jgi:hypothetical protein